MRLIDADKVKQYALTEGFYCDTDADKKATAEEIDQLFPTVEAIPIEWLRKYVDEHDEIVEEGLYWIVEEIIDEWREENGIDRQEQTP